MPLVQKKISNKRNTKSKMITKTSSTNNNQTNLNNTTKQNKHWTTNYKTIRNFKSNDKIKKRINKSNLINLIKWKTLYNRLMKLKTESKLKFHNVVLQKKLKKTISNKIICSKRNLNILSFKTKLNALSLKKKSGTFRKRNKCIKMLKNLFLGKINLTLFSKNPLNISAKDNRFSLRCIKLTRNNLKLPLIKKRKKKKLRLIRLNKKYKLTKKIQLKQSYLNNSTSIFEKLKNLNVLLYNKNNSIKLNSLQNLHQYRSIHSNTFLRSSREFLGKKNLKGETKDKSVGKQNSHNLDQQKEQSNNQTTIKAKKQLEAYVKGFRYSLLTTSHLIRSKKKVKFSKAFFALLKNLKMKLFKKYYGVNNRSFKNLILKISNKWRTTIHNRLVKKNYCITVDLKNETDTYIRVKHSIYQKRIWKRYKRSSIRQYFKARSQKNKFISLNPRFWVSHHRFCFYKNKKTSFKRGRRARAGLYHSYPWLSPILYKRRLYPLRQRRIFLRLKMPSFHKRNQIYFQYTRFLYNQWNPGIRRKTYFRLKNILHKLILSFYGHLKLKQFKHIVKINNALKPKQNSRIAYLLNKLERRLDVVVYRLNFAPTIQWARELVRLGVITVDGTTVTKSRYLIKNFSVIQNTCLNVYKKKFSNFFGKALLQKTIPSHLMLNSKLAAGVFLRAVDKDTLPKNDRVTYDRLNVVRLINS